MKKILTHTRVIIRSIVETHCRASLQRAQNKQYAKFKQVKNRLLLFCVAFISLSLHAKEYHVSKRGNDNNAGTVSSPFETISQAVIHAYPGDTITVHEGVYREWVNPVRGGDSDENRILYRAAAGEKVEIKGSEMITGWQKVKKGIWKIEIPNSFFGDYNPFRDSVFGDWFNDLGKKHHTGDIFLNGQSLYETETIENVFEPKINHKLANIEEQKYVWYCKTTDETTTIYANFHKYNPNKELTEISARKTCFYPTKPGINYITISGFEISQAATQWAAPTAEQIGMIATHWNKGWIIENNEIHDAKCSGITLGKERSTGHNVWSADAENIFRDGNIHYIEVIFKVLRNNWNKEYIGSHIIRNNKIYNCEQAGICGSMGAVFSTIENNHIYDINKKKQFTGFEIAAIKFHAPIDVTIKNNRIHNSVRGIWLDWMTQGARVTGNVLYRNAMYDLFIEVNHGPYIVDNNILLSDIAIANWSQGGAYIHNLIMGKVLLRPVRDRFTPYFEAHSIDVAGLSVIAGGDDRFFHNIFATSPQNNKDNNWLLKYDSTKYPNVFNGNIYINQVKAPNIEVAKAEMKGKVVEYQLIENEDKLQIQIDWGWLNHFKNKELVTTNLLGKTKLSKCRFDDTEGETIIFDTDLLRKEREDNEIIPGPFADVMNDTAIRTIWEKD